MIDLEFVERLIRALDESSLDNLEFERGGTRIHLSKTPGLQTSGPVATAPPGPAAPAAEGGHPVVVDLPAETPAAPSPIPEEEQGAEDAGHLLEVTSPMVGTFYRAPAPDSPPYVDVGTRIGQGTVLCIIEAMKLMNELESEVEGTIAKVLVENAQPVEFGQVLFLIDPS